MTAIVSIVSRLARSSPYVRRLDANLCMRQEHIPVVAAWVEPIAWAVVRSMRVAAHGGGLDAYSCHNDRNPGRNARGARSTPQSRPSLAMFASVAIVRG